MSEPRNVYRDMDERTLASAIELLESLISQDAFVFDRDPDAKRAGCVAALDAARAEAARRAA